MYPQLIVYIKGQEKFTGLVRTMILPSQQCIILAIYITTNKKSPVYMNEYITS